MDKAEKSDNATMRTAVAGEKWASEKLIDPYGDFIESEATHYIRQPDGNTKRTLMKICDSIVYRSCWKQ